MGLLTGKYSQAPGVTNDDVRSNDLEWMGWFRNGKVAPEHATTLSHIAECLKTDGRTLAQGSLAWLWAHSSATVPIPGFRNSRQIMDNTGALELGPLPVSVMQEIEGLIIRCGESLIRER